MPVLINFKICDNAKECNGVAVCPTGALAWDEEKKSIVIDNSKCISCGKCENVCEVDAIFMAKDEKEYDRLKKEIESDSRKVTDLFVDRYGAQPVHIAFLISEDKFQKEVEESHKLVAAELFNDDSIRCLLRSVPMKEILDGYEVKYRKVIAGKDVMTKYNVQELPALAFFKEGKLVGKIEGYYDNKKKEELVKRVKEIVDKE